MRYIGIDPGLSGAVAILPDGHIWDAPVSVIQRGKRQKRVLVPSEMVAILSGYPDVGLITIEQVHAMPRQGVSSMFSLGYGLGLWEGVIAALKLPYQFVTPQRWKAKMLDGMGKDKDASLVVARRLHPELADRLKRSKDHGRAEAILLAEFGRAAQPAIVERITGEKPSHDQGSR